MFDNDRYITKGIRDSIPSKLQTFIWNCIDTLKSQGEQIDCVQIFELTKMKGGVFLQGIIHIQRNLCHKTTYRIFSKEIIYKRVLVIDDGKCTTMLLDEDYWNNTLLAMYFRNKISG